MNHSFHVLKRQNTIHTIQIHTYKYTLNIGAHIDVFLTSLLCMLLILNWVKLSYLAAHSVKKQKSSFDLAWLLFWRDWKLELLSVCACAPLKAGSNCSKLSTVQHSTSHGAWFFPHIYIIVNLKIFMWQRCLERPKQRNITASSLWQIHAHTRKDTRNIK